MKIIFQQIISLNKHYKSSFFNQANRLLKHENPSQYPDLSPVENIKSESQLSLESIIIKGKEYGLINPEGTLNEKEFDKVCDLMRDQIKTGSIKIIESLSPEISKEQFKQLFLQNVSSLFGVVERILNPSDRRQILRSFCNILIALVEANSKADQDHNVDSAISDQVVNMPTGLAHISRPIMNSDAKVVKTDGVQSPLVTNNYQEQGMVVDMPIINHEARNSHYSNWLQSFNDRIPKGANVKVTELKFGLSEGQESRIALEIDGKTHTFKTDRPTIEGENYLLKMATYQVSKVLSGQVDQRLEEEFAQEVAMSEVVAGIDSFQGKMRAKAIASQILSENPGLKITNISLPNFRNNGSTSIAVIALNGEEKTFDYNLGFNEAWHDGETKVFNAIKTWNNHKVQEAVLDDKLESQEVFKMAPTFANIKNPSNIFKEVEQANPDIKITSINRDPSYNDRVNISFQGLDGKIHQVVAFHSSTDQGDLLRSSAINRIKRKVAEIKLKMSGQNQNSPEHNSPSTPNPKSESPVSSEPVTNYPASSTPNPKSESESESIPLMSSRSEPEPETESPVSSEPVTNYPVSSTSNPK